ncbi:transposase [Marinobacterium arenosum]|uniref:transposase n=1 Tax=Marinobacterium arenosum TaxID=2862496 RepID=UPI001C93FBB2|nr:transposase [Marinobacterium arenosum]
MNTSVQEGTHNQIKVVERMAYGYRDTAYVFPKIRTTLPLICKKAACPRSRPQKWSASRSDYQLGKNSRPQPSPAMPRLIMDSISSEL